MGDYFAHWLEMGKLLGDKAPKIYHVNWFRKDKEGKFLWPGFGENMKVLKWIFERCEGSAEGEETAVGIIPKNFEAREELFTIEKKAWLKEVDGLSDYFTLFEDHLPEGIQEELDQLKRRLNE